MYEKYLGSNIISVAWMYHQGQLVAMTHRGNGGGGGSMALGDTKVARPFWIDIQRLNLFVEVL
jgi:hypothetical protein